MSINPIYSAHASATTAKDTSNLDSGFFGRGWSHICLNSPFGSTASLIGRIKRSESVGSGLNQVVSKVSTIRKINSEGSGLDQSISSRSVCDTGSSPTSVMSIP